MWRLGVPDINDKVSYPPCAFPASILLILRIGTGAVQGRYQKTRFGAGLSIGNWVLICRRSESSATGSGDVIDWGRGR